MFLIFCVYLFIMVDAVLNFKTPNMIECCVSVATNINKVNMNCYQLCLYEFIKEKSHYEHSHPSDFNYQRNN